MKAGPELRDAPLFRALSDAEWARIAPRVVRRELRAHEVVFLEGQPARQVWLCVRGRIRLYHTSADGRVTTLEVLAEGDVFGAISALHEDEYPVGAEALSDALLYGLGRDVVVRLVAESPRLAVEILGIVSRRLRAAQERVRSFASDPAPVRLAQALLHAAREGEARVTRRELAEAAGTTVETAIRVLRRLEREGLVRSSVGRVRVVDLAALERMASGHAEPSRDGRR